jgi:hypothetical protein
VTVQFDSPRTRVSSGAVDVTHDRAAGDADLFSK